jgi:hypothetical protein
MSFWQPESKAPNMPRNPYERLAHIYIRLIRGYSPTASQTLETILNVHGPRAAYYAALGLALLARKAKLDGSFDPCDLHTHHLDNLPEVLPLYHKAVEGLVHDIKEIGSRAYSETV